MNEQGSNRGSGSIQTLVTSSELVLLDDAIGRTYSPWGKESQEHLEGIQPGLFKSENLVLSIRRQGGQQRLFEGLDRFRGLKMLLLQVQVIPRGGNRLCTLEVFGDIVTPKGKLSECEIELVRIVPDTRQTVEIEWSSRLGTDKAGSLELSEKILDVFKLSLGRKATRDCQLLRRFVNSSGGYVQLTQGSYFHVKFKAVADYELEVPRDGWLLALVVDQKSAVHNQFLYLKLAATARMTKGDKGTRLTCKLSEEAQERLLRVPTYEVLPAISDRGRNQLS